VIHLAQSTVVFWIGSNSPVAMFPDIQLEDPDDTSVTATVSIENPEDGDALRVMPNASNDAVAVNMRAGNKSATIVTANISAVSEGLSRIMFWSADMPSRLQARRIRLVVDDGGSNGQLPRADTEASVTVVLHSNQTIASTASFVRLYALDGAEIL